MVDKNKYVVLDVETNGLSSEKHDLLSISIYKPDDNKIYNRFLPLDLNLEIFTTEINGITPKMLRGAKHLTQEDVNSIIDEFELKKRIILTYSNLDKRFIKKYFARHNLEGYNYFYFYNIKDDIFSSSFSHGNITKDNLCKILNIENVTEKHSGINDCILEWKLFEAIDNGKLIVINDDVFRLTEDYMIPVSYICNYPKLKKYLQYKLPDIFYKYDIIMSIDVPAMLLWTPTSNGDGMILEHCINRMLNVREIDNINFLAYNKRNLQYWGTLPSEVDIVNLMFEKDGTVSSTEEKYFDFTNQLNNQLLKLKNLIVPMIDYLKKNIFVGEVKSQELVKHKYENILALCDLSDDQNILEIKSHSSFYLDEIKYQLYYQSNGRNCYVIFYDFDHQKLNLAKIIRCTQNEYLNFNNQLKAQKNELKRRRLQKQFEKNGLEIIKYNGKNAFAYFSCVKCKKQFRGKINSQYVIECPYCNPDDFIRFWDFREKDAYDLETLRYELRNKKIKIINWINKNEIYVKCKKCKQTICGSYKELIKESFVCECKKSKHDNTPKLKNKDESKNANILTLVVPKQLQIPPQKEQHNSIEKELLSLQKALNSKSIQISRKASKKQKALFRCMECEYEWEASYREAQSPSFYCPKCKEL